MGFDQRNWTPSRMYWEEMRMLESNLWSEKKHCWSFLVVDARIISLRLWLIMIFILSYFVFGTQHWWFKCWQNICTSYWIIWGRSWWDQCNDANVLFSSFQLWKQNYLFCKLQPKQLKLLIGRLRPFRDCGIYSIPLYYNLHDVNNVIV